MMAVSPLRVALRHCCPRCGQGRLYQSFLKVAPHCDHCQLDLRKADSGDGPAVFVITLLGTLVAVQMVVVEFLYAPPIWMHVLFMSAVCALGAYLLLPPFKSLLIALQYTTQSGDVDANRIEK